MSISPISTATKALRSHSLSIALCSHERRPLSEDRFPSSKLCDTQLAVHTEVGSCRLIWIFLVEIDLAKPNILFPEPTLGFIEWKNVCVTPASTVVPWSWFRAMVVCFIGSDLGFLGYSISLVGHGRGALFR